MSNNAEKMRSDGPRSTQKEFPSTIVAKLAELRDMEARNQLIERKAHPNHQVHHHQFPQSGNEVIKGNCRLHWNPVMVTIFIPLATYRLSIVASNCRKALGESQIMDGATVQH
jgi:hypothetical protein